MPWNGSGVFDRIFSWVADATAGIDINATRMDTDTDDIVTGLNNTRTLDGQTQPTANLPMNGFKHTGAAAASASGQYIEYGQTSWSLNLGTFTNGAGFLDTSAAFNVTIGFTSSVTLTAGRALTVDVANASRTLKLTGNAVLNQDVSTAGSPTFASGTITAGLTVNAQGTGGGIGPVVIQSNFVSNLGNGATSNIATLVQGQIVQVFADLFVTGIASNVKADVVYDGFTIIILNKIKNGTGVDLTSSGAILQLINNSGSTNNFTWKIS